MKHFSGRVAFVTGCGSRIGYGLVQNSLKLGMKVVAVDFNRTHLQEKWQALAGRADMHFVHDSAYMTDDVASISRSAALTISRIARNG
jgi:NAD(P)-dependent dehydrogenase (short-subunit alcohol dehydrogenase family)